MLVTKSTLQCPFNWHIDEVLISQYDEKNELEVSVNTQPVIALMNSVMNTFANFKQGNYEGAENNLQKTDKIWNEIIEHKKNQIKYDNISVDVLKHIKEATKIFVLEKISSPKANKVLDNITNFTEFKSKIENATVEGCKSIIWLNFHEHAFQKAMDHAKLAYTNSPECSLWNFILAKTLRFSRRCENYSPDITKDEQDHLIRSYDLLPIPYYAIYLAEMYRDLRLLKKAKIFIYKEISSHQQSDLGILLRLTKLYISFNNFEKAKECLDHLEKFIPHDSAFLFYKGLYFEKQKKYKEAIEYIKLALDVRNNYMAERTYIRCMINADKEDVDKSKFKYLDYLKQMEKKYEGGTKQAILLDIGLYYYFQTGDIWSAASYLTQSIKINPENKCYHNYHYYHKGQWINVFDLIKNDLRPKFKEIISKSSSSRHESILKDLMDVCPQK